MSVRDNDLLNIQLMPNQPAWLQNVLEELQGLRFDKAAQEALETSHKSRCEEWADLYEEAEEAIKTARRQIDEGLQSIQAAHDLLKSREIDDLN